jgi:cellulose synthase/poly-beta-1,6-N-acetylglucosamine synthase-like glycosyltransferase
MLPLVCAVFFWIPLGLLFYNWIGFPALLLLLVKLLTRRPEPPHGPDRPLVTIAIAAYDEEGCIRDKIRNCLDQDYPAGKLEILVGSDGSDDATDEIVRGFGLPQVRLLRLDQRSGKPSVLNLLIGQARGELVLFTDADVMMGPGAVAAMVVRFTDASVGAVHAHYHRVGADSNPAEGLFDQYEAWLKNLEGKLGAVVGAYGWALMVRRSLCRPMPRDTILDDFLIGIRPFRRGYAVVYEMSAQCWTKVEAEGVEFKRKVRISRGNVQAFLRNADLLSPKYGVKAWVLFSHKILRLMGPCFLLSLLVASAVGFRLQFFSVVFWAQAVIWATVPLVLVVQGPWRRLLAVQYYFYTNVALMAGCWQFVFGRSSTSVWERTERAAH